VTRSRRRRTPARAAAQLSLPLPDRRRLRLPPRVVTVDLDATLYDPWACHGYAGDHRSSDGCTHVRWDTLDAVREVCARTAAQPVVLSWRGGLLAVSRAWLAEIPLDVTALFIPGAPDDLTQPGHRSGQVGFKEATVRSLLGAGVEVVASFDDNRAVLAALQAAGVDDVRLVPHLVDVAPWEWSAGYLGAPRPVLDVPAAPRGRLSDADLFESPPPRTWLDEWLDEGAFGGDDILGPPARATARSLPRAIAVHDQPRRQARRRS
jgi:hypothetical protein